MTGLRQVEAEERQPRELTAVAPALWQGAQPWLRAWRTESGVPLSNSHQGRFILASLYQVNLRLRDRRRQIHGHTAGKKQSPDSKSQACPGLLLRS